MKTGFRDVLILCDGEEEYALLMSDFLKTHKDLPWEIRTYTTLDTLLDREKKEEIALLVMAESVYSREINELHFKKLVILNESGIRRGGGIVNISKYQQAEEVLKKLLESYADIAEAGFPKLTEGYHTKIIGVYSPVRRCYQTTFALTMSQLLAEKNRTLYLNFEYYAGNPELLLDMQTKDLADLLYFLNADRDKFGLRMQSMVQHKGMLDYIPPMRSGQNLLHITTEEWMQLLQNITGTGEYEYIVLDLSESIQGLFELLRNCHKVFTLVQEDAIAKCKLMQYEQMLELYEYEDVLQKTHKCQPPHIRKVPEEIEYYTKGELREYVKREIDFLQK